MSSSSNATGDGDNAPPAKRFARDGTISDERGLRVTRHTEEAVGAVVYDVTPVVATTLHFESGCVINVMQSCPGLTLAIFGSENSVTVHGNLSRLTLGGRNSTVHVDGNVGTIGTSEAPLEGPAASISVGGNVASVSTSGQLVLDVHGALTGTIACHGMLLTKH